jgi:hypothetical protein
MKKTCSLWILPTFGLQFLQPHFFKFKLCQQGTSHSYIHRAIIIKTVNMTLGLFSRLAMVIMSCNAEGISKTKEVLIALEYVLKETVIFSLQETHSGPNIKRPKNMA